MENKVVKSKNVGKKVKAPHPYLEDRIVKIVPTEAGKKWKDLIVNAAEKAKDPHIFNGVIKKYSCPLNNANLGGGIKDILDNETEHFVEEYGEQMTERGFYEKFFKADLNPYSQGSTFWKGDKRAIVELDSSGLTLNLRKPQDMIKYKVALANIKWISPSPEAYKKLRRPTQEFVIVDEAKKKARKVADMMERVEHMQEFNKHFDDKESMMNILGVSGRTLDTKSDINQVRASFTEFFEKKPLIFMDIVKDYNFNTKTFIFKSTLIGLIEKRGDRYSLDTGEELGRIEEVVAWVNNPDNDAAVLRMKGQLKKN
jgi:hypothetical protein